MPIVDDPFTFGAIASVNAISDVYAMGGRPLTALAIAGFPTDVLPLEVLEEILRGGAEKAAEAGFPVAGGWLGGLGIIVLFLAVLPRLNVGGRQALFRTEMPGPEIGLEDTIRETATRSLELSLVSGLVVAILATLALVLFRPLLGWATAWSFDRLRLWLEDRLDPRLAVRLTLIHLVGIPVTNTSVNPARSIAAALRSARLDEERRERHERDRKRRRREHD